MRPKNRVASNRLIRHLRLRKKVMGTLVRPRLSVYPSLKHMEAQIIDDLQDKTLVGFTTKAKEFKKETHCKDGGNVAAALQFGKYVALKAKEKGFEKVVFDRGGFLYHGRLKAFADAAREQGLSF